LAKNGARSASPANSTQPQVHDVWVGNSRSGRFAVQTSAGNGLEVSMSRPFTGARIAALVCSKRTCYRWRRSAPRVRSLRATRRPRSARAALQLDRHRLRRQRSVGHDKTSILEGLKAGP
jgi:hypothetical protein